MRRVMAIVCVVLGTSATVAAQDEAERDPSEWPASSDDAPTDGAAADDPAAEDTDEAIDAIDGDPERDAESDAEPTSDDATGSGDEARRDLDTSDVYVRARAEELFRTGGSVHAIDEETLEQLSYNDPTLVLSRVPGVYVRSEEGFGLRPNIGLRGASAERSRKITLMEDGILSAPAPYSAPAAYYSPLMARMVGVEVSAGPAAILYGPNTIGGAIDMLGRRIPSRREGSIDVSLGNTWYGRAHLHYGDSNEWGGFLVELLHLRSNGFHELDAAPSVSDDTGFHRTDILLRGEVHGMLDASFYHRLELSVGVGLEESNETYLGTSDADFRDNPYLRYASTQLDRMAWWRTRVHLRYELESDDVQVRITAYRHDFQRTWYRLDHFCDTLEVRPAGQQDTCRAAVGFDRILRDPDVYASQFGRLTGRLDPQPGDAPLVVLRNHRIFGVQGVQADGRLRFTTGDFAHHVQVGARVHYDEITREHTGDTYQLARGQMVLQNPGLELERNHHSAWAVAAYASWAVTWNHLTITPGVRTELIWTRAEDKWTGVVVNGEQYALLPGVGAQYEILPELAAFAGAHLGYSPVAPGSGPEVLPEVAWNYEVGARYGRITDRTHGQLTLFASDYDNLSSVCTLASGCSEDLIDRQLNAGQVLVLGIEAEASHTITVDEVSIPLSASYTWTWSRFQSAFESDNPQFGSVEIGDQLPYVPEHVLSMRAGFEYRVFRVFVNGIYTSPMRDVAGQGPFVREESTDEFFMLDAQASIEALPGVRFYVRGENLTNAQPILTRRAWGARGTKPLLVQGGVQIDFR